MVRLVPVKTLPKHKNDIVSSVERFLESGFEMALVDYQDHYASPGSCLSAYNQSINNNVQHCDDVYVKMINGKVFLIRRT